MHIIFLIKGSLEKNVPIINQITVALDKKHRVSVICTDCQKKLLEMLEEKGAEVHCSMHAVFGISVVKKATDWLGVRKQFFKILGMIHKEGDVLYVGSLDTALAMGNRLTKFKYILHIRELYDKYPQYLRLLQPIAQSARVVIVPEYCRAAMLKCWLRLNRSPVVIPNKPYKHPREKNLTIDSKEIESLVNNLCDKKIIIYQGNISRDRDIKALVGAILNNNDGKKFALLLMGTNHGNYLEEIKKEYPEIYYINYVPAPFHLQITSHAYMGLVTYDDSCLNNMFCAPNKIYEYCGFGIPVLGRDIPGLKYTIDYYKAGLCVDFSDNQAVQKAIKEIDANYLEYSSRANAFYDSIDIGTLFDNMIHIAQGYEL